MREETCSASEFSGIPSKTRFSLRMYMCERSMYMDRVLTDTSANVFNTSSTDTTSARAIPPMFWVVIDSCLFVTIVFGNVLTILAIALTRRLRSIVSNYFILNLAVSDLLVGITVPYHLATYLDGALDRNELTCMMRYVLTNIALGSSIYNIIAIAVDRYIAIVHPLSYNAYATRRRVLLMIAIVWIYPIIVSVIPIYWNRFDTALTCDVETVMPRYYIIAVQMPSFFMNWITMFVLYWKIWREAHMCARRMHLSTVSNTVAERNDRKSIQVVLMILGCFSICWFPYFTLACLRSFELFRNDTTLAWYQWTFVLVVANSGMNPVIYAWKNANFRKAFQRILRFQSPNTKMNSNSTYFEKLRELRNQKKELESVSGSGNLRSSDASSNYTEENKVESTTL